LRRRDDWFDGERSSDRDQGGNSQGQCDAPADKSVDEKHVVKPLCVVVKR
jgi:hypothetical protein